MGDRTRALTDGLLDVTVGGGIRLPRWRPAPRRVWSLVLIAVALGAVASCRRARTSESSAEIEGSPEPTSRRSAGQVPLEATSAASTPDAWSRPANGAIVPRWDWNGVLGTGQSLSVGAAAAKVTLTRPSFRNLKLSLGRVELTVPPYDPAVVGPSVVPLTEPIRPIHVGYPGPYPSNIYGESPHTAMASQISATYRDAFGGDYVTVHSVVGESGQPMSVLDKSAIPTLRTGHAYAASLFEVAVLARLAKTAGKSYGVSAIVLTHGESDATNEAYPAALYRLYRDYRADVEAITGQRSELVMFVTQQQTQPSGPGLPVSMLAAWRAGLEHPDEIVCVGPKYQYAYAQDRLHLTAQGYDHLGEKYGEVYYERVILGRRWRPLEPLLASRRGSTVVVRFHVPVPPLAWDERLPAPHRDAHRAWASGRGFEVEDELGEVPITNAAIEGDGVVLTLAREPGAGGLTVRYAFTQDGPGDQGGTAAGRIGQLRDSDPRIGYATGMPLYNHAVSFVLPVE